MALGSRVGSILLIAAIGAGIYALVKWEIIGPHGDEIGDFAEQACVDEIRRRYNAARVSAYAVNKNANGYTVRTSVSLTRGRQANAYCLTNANGGVREVGIEEK